MAIILTVGVSLLLAALLAGILYVCFEEEVHEKNLFKRLHR